MATVEAATAVSNDESAIAIGPKEGQLMTSGFDMSQIVFNVSDAQIADLRKEFTGLTVADTKDKVGYEKLSKAIAKLRSYRTGAKDCHKQLKADALAYSRKVDGELNRITDAILAIEEPLKKEKERIDALIQEEKDRIEREKQEKMNNRFESLKALGVMLNPIVVMKWTDEEFETELANYALKKAEADRIEEDRKKAEAERQAALEAERAAMEAERRKLEEARAAHEEMIRQQREEEQKRLDAERAEKERLEAIEAAKKAEAERIAAEEKAKREAEERAELERKAKAEREALEAERAALEKERAAIRAEQLRIEAERAEAARIEKERLEAEAKAEKARLEAIAAEEDRKRREERAAALLPDAQKLKAFADQLESIEYPTGLSTTEARDFLGACLAKICEVANELRSFGK